MQQPVEFNESVSDALLSDIASTAAEAARAAGRIQLSCFRGDHLAAKKSARDVKLEVDRRCEEAIVRIIRDRFPGHGILAEEDGFRGGSEPWLWIVDPLDGTVNFFHGFPQFCSCVACFRQPENQPPPVDAIGLLAAAEVGAVYVPVFEEMYLGIRGCGATCNGDPVVCNGAHRLSESVVALSFGKTAEGMERMLHITGRLAPRVRKLRSWGCAGLDILQVAHGRLGALLYRGIHLWDIAAAGLILSEAGGHLQACSCNGGRWDMVASVPGLRDELMEVLGSSME
ncbi:MAG: hypothetical protein LJE65_08440 [Desulfobacteraceae bacterium]|nr:hypothetical protein [Desulfobacteraceae bacterium]